MSGLLAWNLFSEITTRCVNVFVENGSLMKKMNFPRITLPAIVIGSALFNNFLLFLMMLVVFLILGHEFGPMILWVIPLTILVVTVAIGFGLILGVVNVFVRDTGEVVTIVMQFWFWFTPIIYPVSIIPEKYHYLLYYNPIFPIIDAYHQAILYDQSPNLYSLGPIAIIGIVLMLLGLFLIRTASAEMADLL
jgi:lipopolysaccharide transport system permease protein